MYIHIRTPKPFKTINVLKVDLVLNGVGVSNPQWTRNRIYLEELVAWIALIPMHECCGLEGCPLLPTQVEEHPAPPEVS